MKQKKRTTAKRRSAAVSAVLAALLMTALLAGCGASGGTAAPAEPASKSEPAETAATTAPEAEPETAPEAEPETAPEAEPEAEPETEPEAEPEAEPETEPARQDGERFEGVVMIEGMEETVRYEHIRNETLGFEMDYDYENFERISTPERERFVSIYDDPENPENYLDLSFEPQDAETVAAAVSEELSKSYEIRRDDAFLLGRAGSCIRIDASADVGGLTMPDQLQMVYIIPAEDGCFVAVEHYYIVGSEGFGRRFRGFMDSFALIPSP